MKTQILLLILISALVFSCEEKDEPFKVNLDTFEAVTEEYPFSGLAPGTNPDYWEVDHVIHGNVVVAQSSGVKCDGAADQEACLDEFESVDKGYYGFGGSCPPGNCFMIIKYQMDGETFVVREFSELKQFLGQIDSKSDAILLLLAEGCQFSSTSKEAGAIRETESGYQTLVTLRISDCMPIQHNRYLLNVGRDGSIKVLEKEERYYYHKDACI